MGLWVRIILFAKQLCTKTRRLKIKTLLINKRFDSN